MSVLRVKRAYDPPANDDGCRVLVDRLWPRGIKREAAHIDSWIKDVSPSNELRRWFGHDPAKWAEFQRRYRAELSANDAAVQELRDLIARNRRVTLLFGAKDEAHNNAVALREYLLSGSTKS